MTFISKSVCIPGSIPPVLRKCSTLNECIIFKPYESTGYRDKGDFDGHRNVVKMTG